MISKGADLHQLLQSHEAALPHSSMCSLHVRDRQLLQTCKCWENLPMGKYWVEHTQWQDQSWESQVLHGQGSVSNKSCVHLMKGHTGNQRVMIAFTAGESPGHWSCPPTGVFRLLGESSGTSQSVKGNWQFYILLSINYRLIHSA